MSTSNTLKLALMTAATTLVSSHALAIDAKLPFPGTVTGNVSVVSSYILRGITNVPESSGAALQGGLDYSHPSGFYAGYWASKIDYSYACINPNVNCDSNDKTSTLPVASDNDTRHSLESDFYFGYKGKLDDHLGYQIGLTTFYYSPGWESTGYETILGLTYDNLTLTAQTMLNDVSYGNAGDTYFLASYTQPLWEGFTGKAQLGAYYYKKTGDFLPESDTSFSFRHATLGVSHPLGNSGATMSLDYIIGGKDRYDIKQDNTAVLGLSYTF